MIAIQDAIPDNHCWGCGARNPQGLRIKSYWDGDGNPHSVDSVTLDLGASGRLTARIRSVDESPPDELAVQGVMEYLACSLDRIATTQAPPARPRR